MPRPLLEEYSRLTGHPRIIKSLGLVPPDLMEQLDQRLREHLAL
jgi:mRNA-degrading endonuclease toxin of MazEF toxin-antitoxin module